MMLRRGLWGARRRIGGGGRILLVLIAVIALLVLLDLRLAPAVESVARQKAHSAALSAMEQAVRQTLLAHPEYQDYQQLMYVEKDTNGHVALMIPNTMRLNAIVSDTMLDLEKRWETLQKQNISIPLGMLSGSRVLSGWGPDIHIAFSAAHAPALSLKDEFIAAGVNQTRHRIWLDMSGEILIFAPFSRETVLVQNTMLLAESVIVGPIPEAYLNFNL